MTLHFIEFSLKKNINATAVIPNTTSNTYQQHQKQSDSSHQKWQGFFYAKVA